MTTPTNKGDALPYKAVPIESVPSFWCVIDAAGTRITEQAMEEPAAHRTAKYLSAAWQAAKQSVQVQEAEAMCGDHGGIEGCSCSLCGSPLGPPELCAFCNGCGASLKWPLADGGFHRAPVIPQRSLEVGVVTELRDEMELLGSMVRAERATAIAENRQCTDEQLERCFASLDRLSGQHGEGLGVPGSEQPVGLSGSTLRSGAEDGTSPSIPDANQADTCILCGKPMPPGEESFMYHGYSGPCPK